MYILVNSSERIAFLIYSLYNFDTLCPSLINFGCIDRHERISFTAYVNRHNCTWPLQTNMLNTFTNELNTMKLNSFRQPKCTPWTDVAFSKSPSFDKYICLRINALVTVLSTEYTHREPQSCVAFDYNEIQKDKIYCNPSVELPLLRLKIGLVYPTY